MVNVSIGGRSYGTIPVALLDEVLQHPLVKPLELEPSKLSWMQPASLYAGVRRKKRPLFVPGHDGQELVLVDQNCELVLCMDEDINCGPDLIEGKKNLRTSDARKNALRVAYEFYEQCSGELKLTNFDVGEGSKRLGLPDEEDAEAIFSYLISSGIMVSPYIGSGKRVRFTDFGISVIEGSIDRPETAIGPFPPLSVVVGNIGAGAQVAIGSGQFTQERQHIQGPQLRDLLPLIRAASAELRAGGHEHEVTLLTAAESEVSSDECDKGYLKATLLRVAKSVGNGVVDSATHALLAYCKSQGLLL